MTGISSVLSPTFLTPLEPYGQVIPSKEYTIESLKDLNVIDLNKIKALFKYKIAEVIKRNEKPPHPLGARYNAQGKLIPRNRNCFFLFCTMGGAREREKAKLAISQKSNTTAEISKCLAEKWKTFDKRIKLSWGVLSLQEELKLLKKYPWYRFQLGKRKHPVSADKLEPGRGNAKRRRKASISTDSTSLTRNELDSTRSQVKNDLRFKGIEEIKKAYGVENIIAGDGLKSICSELFVKYVQPSVRFQMESEQSHLSLGRAKFREQAAACESIQ